MKWLISANGKMYDHIGAFDEFGFIDWRQKANYEVGDIVYIYATKPYMRVMFKTIVEKVDMSSDEIIDDKDFWYDIDEYKKSLSGKYVRLRLVERVDSEKLSLYELKENGLKTAPQGPQKVREQLEAYLESNFNDYYSEGVFPEEVSKTLEEGHRHTITVNKYERSSIARKKCIEEHGLNCAVCDMNFGEVYGEVGKEFIHVHHIVPLNKVGGSYKVDYKKDLVPVCPNCHAMLHRKIGEENISVNELKKIFNT